MPIGEIVAEVLGGVVRFVGSIVLDVLADFVVRGPGYLIGRVFKKDIEPDGTTTFLLGLLFWGLVGCGWYFAFPPPRT